MPTSWKEERGTAGFTVNVDEERGLIQMRFWGIWDDELGVKFEKAMKTALGMAPLPPSWGVLADISNYPPQRPSVQARHAACMGIAKTRIRRAANLVSSSLSQMQIRRLSEESGLPAYSFFTREAEAVRWVLADDAADSGRNRA